MASTEKIGANWQSTYVWACVQESERPIKDSAESMMGSGRKSLPISSGGSGGLRDSGSQYRSSSGGIRGIMENLSQHQDVSGQVSMLSTLVCCVVFGVRSLARMQRQV